MLLQASIDPSTWFVDLPSGIPRMSSPIILKRDLTTFTYLANKRNLQGLSLHLLQKTWKLQQSYARRVTILKLITGWNVDGSRYALYTQDPQAKLVNARCPLCLAPDSDLHWICECPCPALKEPRDTPIHETVPAHLRQLLTHTENIRNASSHSSMISAEPYVPVSSTVHTANSFEREPRPPI